MLIAYLISHSARLLSSSDPDSNVNAYTSPDKYSHFSWSVMTAEDDCFHLYITSTVVHSVGGAQEHWAEAGTHPGWAISLSQGTMHMHIHTHAHTLSNLVPLQACWFFFSLFSNLSSRSKRDSFLTIFLPFPRNCKNSTSCYTIHYFGKCTSTPIHHSHVFLFPKTVGSARLHTMSSYALALQFLFTGTK